MEFQSFNSQKEEDLFSKLNSDSIKSLMDKYGITEENIDRLFKTQFQKKEALGSKTIREAIEKKVS